MENCKWCDLIFKNKHALARHCRARHKEEWDIEKKIRFKVINRNSDGSISCPLCEFTGANIYRHLIYKHSSTRDELAAFRKAGYALQADRRSRNEAHACEICSREYNLANGLAVHMKTAHPEVYAKREYDTNPLGEGFECGCCGAKKKQIKQHVKESHPDISWDDYCVKFNHDPLRKMFMSESHKESLSKNKLKFFNETDEGREWRRLHSINFSENNISKRADVREKLAQSMLNRFISNDHMNFVKLSYGTYIRFKFEGKEHYVRSFEEFKIILTLLLHDKYFEYEAVRIPYFHENKQKTYLLDLVYDEEYIEIKSDKYLESKFSAIRDTLKIDSRDLLILNHKKFCERYNLPIYTGTYFCDKLNQMVECGNLISLNQITKSNNKSVILSRMTAESMSKFTKKQISDRRVMYEYCGNV